MSVHRIDPSRHDVEAICPFVVEFQLAMGNRAEFASLWKAFKSAKSPVHHESHLIVDNRHVKFFFKDRASAEQMRANLLLMTNHAPSLKVFDLSPADASLG